MRQNIRFDPSVKLFESFADFSGGVNSETSNERLRDNEFIILDNVDLSGRGSAKRRTGRVNALRTVITSGKGQGLFNYYRKGQLTPDLILAVGGKLYSVTPIGTGFDNPINVTGLETDWHLDPGKEIRFSFTAPWAGTYTFETTSNLDLKMILYDENAVTLDNDDDDGIGSNPLITYTLAANTEYLIKVYGYDALTEGDFTLKVTPPEGVVLPPKTTDFTPVAYNIPITGLDAGFQTKLPIEAAQYKDLMVFATGTKLVEYDGTTAKVMEPYKPTAMEAIYIGTNAIADNPDSYIQDQEATTLDVAIKPQKRSGVTNQITTMTAFVSKPATITSVKYKWEWRKVGDTAWQLGRDYTADAAGKSWDFKPTTTGKFELKVTVQNAAVTTQTADYTITNYPVNDVEDKANVTLPVDSIQTCRKIILHWDRFILAKDNLYPHQMYISDLNNPRYFPTTNSINFDANKQEPITALVRYRDMLVVFTKTTVQTLVGKSPSDYRRALIHDGIGCIADRTAHVIGNHIVFLSNEGIQMLAPSALTLDTLNVKRIDSQIKSAIVRDPDAAGLVHDGQYWICLPSQSIIYRFYYDGTVWVRDKSSKLNIVAFAEFENRVYELTFDGKLYKQDNSVYSDVDEVYDMLVESKFLDLSTSFNQKKLKRLYVLAKHFTATVNLKVKVYADSALVLDPDSGQAVVNADGAVEWVSTTEPNIKFYAGTVIGEWIMGVTPLGDVQLSVQRASVRGKCRRVKVIFEHSEAKQCEIYAFGLEFKQKKV